MNLNKKNIKKTGKYDLKKWRNSPFRTPMVASSLYQQKRKWLLDVDGSKAPGKWIWCPVSRPKPPTPNENHRHTELLKM